MKWILLLNVVLCSQLVHAQQMELVKGIELDSSYAIACLDPGTKYEDSLLNYWFYVDDLKEMQKIAKDWVFTKKVDKINAEYVSVEILIIKEKRPINQFALVFPRQQIISRGYPWFKFDLTKLSSLHQRYPFNTQKKIYHFDNYMQYVAFANTHIADSSLFFFFEPSLRYEGSFSIITQRIDDPTGMFTVRDVNLELRALAAAGTFSASYAETDSINSRQDGDLRIKVECSRSLYDQYSAKHRKKSEWTPTPIEMKSYWKK